MQKVIVQEDLSEIRKTLKQMGDLTVADFQEAAKANFLAQASCNRNDAPTAAGSKGWFDTVRNLTDCSLPKGFVRKDIENSPRLVSPAGNFSIMVATGDDATGNPFGTPKTKSHKGNTTISAVELNQKQYLLFSKDMAPQVVPLKSMDMQAVLKNPLWVFLVYVHVDKSLERPQHLVRCELSLPVGFDKAGHISAWMKRIIFPSLSPDPEKLLRETKTEFAPEQRIILKRKK